MSEILVEEYRDSVLENVNRGFICAVNDKSEVIYQIGDPEYMTFYRSASKPIQALPVLQYGVMEKYGLTEKEFAIFCGSHRGEPFHINTLESIMKKTGLKEEDCIMLPAYSLNRNAMEELLLKNIPRRKIYHNCFGKHLAILLLCRELGCNTEDYWKADSPAQLLIKKYISVMSGYNEEKINIGVDGCGVPVFAMPIKYLANTFLRMACPELIEDAGISDTVKVCTRIMNENFEMVSGTDAICSLILMDKNIVAKGGAKGVYCFGLKKERMAFAMKVEDGAEENLPLIVASILEQIEYSNSNTIKRIRDCFSDQIINDGGRIVGVKKIVFKLK